MRYRLLHPTVQAAANLLTSPQLDPMGRNPMTGRARPELLLDLRSFPYGAYLILYRIADDGRRSFAWCTRPAISRTPSERRTVAAASRRCRLLSVVYGCMSRTNLTAGARLPSEGRR